MSKSTDPGHFFQTDASESTRARRAAKSGNKNGNPIVLKSKILNVIPDPFSASCIYVAESAGCVKQVIIDTRVTKAIWTGPTAPITSIAIGGANGAIIFAACWDKDIWSWARDRTLIRKYKGHSDFVKTIICARIGGKDCLVSGGADAKIMIWDTATGERLYTLRDKSETMMAVQDLVVDPEDSNDIETVVVSASSDPTLRRWHLGLSSGSQILDVPETSQVKATRSTILEHETSVYKLLFSGDDEDSDLWTASADGTAKCLSRSKNWAAEETYWHGDYVRAVVVVGDLAVTAGRDEDVKVWDRLTGKLRHVYEGHFEEVTGLVAFEAQQKVVSVSIDGTIRTWSLQKADLEKAIKEREEKLQGVVKEEQPKPKKSLMTAEEEAELADLMGSDDD